MCWVTARLVGCSLRAPWAGVVLPCVRLVYIHFRIVTFPDGFFPERRFPYVTFDDLTLTFI